MCKFLNTTPEFYYNLIRSEQDKKNRVELNNGAYEFLANQT